METEVDPKRAQQFKDVALNNLLARRSSLDLAILSRTRAIRAYIANQQIGVIAQIMFSR